MGLKIDKIDGAKVLNKNVFNLISKIKFGTCFWIKNASEFK